MNKKVTIEIKNKLKRPKNSGLDYFERRIDYMFQNCGLPAREDSKIYTAELKLIKEKITKSELLTYLKSGKRYKDGHWYLKLPGRLGENYTNFKKEHWKDCKIKIVSIDDV